MIIFQFTYSPRISFGLLCRVCNTFDDYSCLDSLLIILFLHVVKVTIKLAIKSSCNYLNQIQLGYC